MRRICRLEIPGLTDGADTLPEAEIEYPVGDTVWVAFIGGDPRYPIITGSRNPQAGNSVFQLNPDTITGSTTQALTLTIGSTSVSLTPNGLNLTCGGATVQMTPDSIKFNAGRIDLN